MPFSSLLIGIHCTHGWSKFGNFSMSSIQMYTKMVQECTPEVASCLIFENKFLTALCEQLITYSAAHVRSHTSTRTRAHTHTHTHTRTHTHAHTHLLVELHLEKFKVMVSLVVVVRQFGYIFLSDPTKVKHFAFFSISTNFTKKQRSGNTSCSRSYFQVLHFLIVKAESQGAKRGAKIDCCEQFRFFSPLC